jgi:CDP-diacylglycerol pyrophosphatase
MRDWLRALHSCLYALAAVATMSIVLEARAQDIRAVLASQCTPPKPPPTDANDQLLHIVRDRCVPSFRKSGDPSPCAAIEASSGDDIEAGIAVLKDRKPGAHYLTIAIRPITGIESPLLLASGTPNYFAAAWANRRYLEAVLNHTVPRDAVGLAVNSVCARGQEQLHIHMECLRQDVHDSLREAAETLSTDRWTNVAIAGSTYDAIRVSGEDLDAFDPVRMLTTHLASTGRKLSAETSLVAAGVRIGGTPGFVILTHDARPSGEQLLDPNCEVSGGISEAARSIGRP